MMNHELRSYGQTRKCCEEDFYKLHGKVEEVASNRHTVSRINLKKFKELRWCMTKAELEQFFAFTEDPKKFWEWHGYAENKGGYTIADFSSNLFYPHCDYRSQHDYGTGTTDTAYLEAALNVLRLSPKTSKAARDKFIRNESHGIYGAWHFVHLSYSDYQKHAQYGMMHALKGICHFFISFISKSRSNSISKNMSTYFSERNLHQYGGSYPWNINSSDETQFDCTLNCLLRPSGLHEEKAPRIMYQKLGSLKAIEIINLFSYFLPYLVHRVGDNFGSSYKAFISMLACNVRDLMKRFITAADAKELQKR